MGDPRIVRITLDDKSVVRRSGDVEHERAVAIYDLLEDNHFAPVGDFSGPYGLHLRIEEGRLLFEIYRGEGKGGEGEKLATVPLALGPFRRIVKDYFTVCETYYDAIRTASPSKIEAIDMGRRGLHNEGAEALRERLAGRIEIDENTARRLFTLLCVLHIKS
ncbi:Uncharacterized protein, UPF0262 family [Tistlia consotensis]|uniref:UPF0262 protein SAMN05428998_15011 n=1 Tax=Tistlia consotensis USBA 355 TaxID=560819 RepID=A0A1Y6CRV4_9PROT|nr:UPF0262 family protein [Tistlia consotensis]SMF83515.1 Uncharacterized protein, UPF0262 family [Tistlia consotensis USBA 355]SNS33769.1 Uncharacterized protein, UPF0262 family [Tistlia consotensis]